MPTLQYCREKGVAADGRLLLISVEGKIFSLVHELGLFSLIKLD